MSFAEPIWARGHVAARRGRTHDRFRTAANFAEPPLTFAGRSLIAFRLSTTFCLLEVVWIHSLVNARKSRNFPGGEDTTVR
jgi:hypothetical protein